MYAIASALTAQPNTLFKRHRHFYLLYDGAYFVLLSAALALMSLTQFSALIPTWETWCWIALPFAIYSVILCHVFIHNASHVNFPRSINRFLGEIFGLVVLTRFASWEIVHQRHHRYSDDPERDPHNLLPNYWPYVIHSLANVEKQLQAQYLDTWGDTPENRRHEKIRAVVSFGTGVVLALFWYRLLGPAGFFGLFLPASICGMLHVIHFNWVTHNALARNGEYYPVNLNDGIFKIGNKLFFGIYFHANHHKRANLFNPANMSARLLDDDARTPPPNASASDRPASAPSRANDEATSAPL